MSDTVTPRGWQRDLGTLLPRRPSVDKHCYKLAELFLDDQLVLPDDAVAAREDEIWELASEIQCAIESWLDDGAREKRLESK